MKFISKQLFLLFILAIIISNFSGCKSSNESVNQKTNSASNETVASNSDQPEKTDKPKSDYPPFPSALAKAEIKKLDNSTFKMEDKKGNVVLLNLWATWCGPCRGEMPHLVEMENEFKSKNFEVIGLNTDDESVEDINAFAQEMKLNYQMAYADMPMMKEFLNVSKFQGIPQSYLVDRNGNLRGVFLGGGPKVISTMKETVEKVVNE